MKKKRNPQDLTLRNLRAVKKLIKKDKWLEKLYKGRQAATLRSIRKLRKIVLELKWDVEKLKKHIHE